MTDLERRALLGDREAQEECTRQGIVLPCPCCGKEAVLKQLSGRWAVCCSRNCVGSRVYNDKQQAITTWNTRQAPPLVRCEKCKHWYKEHCAHGPSPCCTLQTPADYYCPYGEPKEAYHETN